MNYFYPISFALISATKTNENDFINSFTWLSRPTVKSMRKNRTAHSWGRGSLETASGYTTKAIPGPESGTRELRINR